MSIDSANRRLIYRIIGVGFVMSISTFLVHLLFYIKNFYFLLIATWVVILLIIGLIAEGMSELSG